jgi:hypothetical protein
MDNNTPMLDTITERLEADASVVDIVLDDFVLVEPPTVAVMKFLRQVPVVEGLKRIRSTNLNPDHHRDQYTYHEGSNACSEELVNNFGVELDSLGVNRVVPSSKRDDAGPGNGEPVGSDAVLLEKGNIFPPEAIRVCSNIAILTVQSLSGSPREIVPDGFASTVDINRTLNLETR